MNTYNLKYPLWKFFPLIILIFNPKIDIVSFPGFWQGLRLDDIIILFYSIYFLFSNNLKVYPNLINQKMYGFNWIVFFPYIILTAVIGNFFEISQSLIVFLRYCEYIGLIIILNQLDPSKDKIILLFKIYIILNFLIVLLQYFGLIGAFTSRGGCFIDTSNINDINRCYDKDKIKSICFFNCGYGFIKNYQLAGQFDLNRVPGITGGPWELSVNLAISFFGLILLEKNIKKLLPFLLMIILMIIIGQSRGIIFGFVAGLLFTINDYKKVLKLSILSLIFLIFLYFINIFNFREIVQNKFLLDYFFLIKIIISPFLGNLPPIDSVKGTGLESMYFRALAWQEPVSILKRNNFFIFFGSGLGSSIYTESLIIRAITSFGLCGVLILLYLIRKLPLFFIIFIVVTGLTIDLYISFKIFLFTNLFFILYSKNKTKLIQK